MNPLGTMHPTDVISRASTDSISNIVFAANVAQAIDVPTGAGYVNFSANVDFWVAFCSTTVFIPTSSTTAGSSSNTSIINPTARNFHSTQSCTGISVISASSGYLALEWFTRA